MTLNREQTGVIFGMGVALSLALAGFAVPLVWPSFPGLPRSSEERFTLWAATSTIAAFWVVLAVVRLARHRLFSAEDLHGSATANGSPRARILQAVLQNTLEQAFLAVIAYGAWVALADFRSSALPALFALYFSVGRALFFFNYTRGAAARALGFALTFYPSACLIVATLAAAIVRLVAA